MATNYPEHSSPEDTHKHEEVGIIGCSCQAKNIERIQEVCNENKINTKLTQLSSEKPYILDKLSGCVCPIILLCSHYLELLSASITGSKQQTSLILVGDWNDLSRLSSHGLVSVRSDEPDFIQILFDMIHTKINYDDCFGTTNAKGCQSRDETDQNGNPNAEYEELGDLQIGPKSKQDFDHEATVNRDEDTNYTKYGDSGDQNPYQTLSLELRANLINLRTGQSGKDALSGANVVEKYFHPSRSYWKELSEIISDINEGNKATVSELTKYVYTYVIPSAKEHKDLSTLSKLSECEGHGIEDKIAKEIQDLLFTSEVTRHQMDVLIQSLEVHLTVVNRKALSCKTTRTILPNVILMLAFVYHVVLDLYKKDEKMDERISKLDTLLDRTIYAPNQNIERHLQNATRMMIKGLKKTTNSKRPSCPQLLGRWREELMSNNTISNMTCAIAKMTLPELYSLIARLFVQMHLGMELSNRLIDFLHTVVKKSAKKADNSQLYPLLVIVCRGITSLLNRHVHQDQQTVAMQNQTNDSLCEILKTCVEKIKNKTNLDCRKALQEELAILLFHRSSNVARNVDRLMSVLGGVCIADKIPAYLQTILGPLGLTLSSETNESCPKTLPRWQELKGYIAGHREASVSVLLPDNNTFDMQTYVKSAKLDPTNGRHYNTMDVLKCLLGNDQHPHIRRLMAFQVQPMPVFYITELLPDATLSTFLLATRKEFDWQPLKMLGSIALACVDVVRFLHERGIVHRNLIADSFKRRDKDTFVLADLSIASYVDDDSVGSGTFVQDIDGKFIPTRWSAPESLLYDRYDAMSDTWMLGLLMQEIFTHGVHPFRDMYATTLDDIIENVVFNNLRPRWYPCIPCPIFEIIVGCVKTNQDERLELPEVLKKIRDWLGSLRTEKEKLPKLRPAIFNKKNSEYPELDEHQGEPERGPTEQLKNLKKTNKGSKASYYNNVDLRRLSKYPNKIRIKEEHLKAVDHPTIEKKEGGLEVREPVSKAFMNDTFSKMTSKPEFMAALTIADNPEKLPRSSTDPEGFIWTLMYRCQNAESLYEIAQINRFGDPSDEENQLSYLKVVESLVQFVNWMHERSWILRDICCSTTYRAVEDGRVFIPRLGRMIKDQRRISRIEACIIDKNTCTEDRRNWMPAEVINGGQFSQASDVYMVAMTVYEFYSTADLGRNNPMHNRLASVPFAKVDPKLLLDTLNRGVQPAKPMSCPQWLYELMQKCWDRDSTQRLTAAAFLSEISEKLATESGSTRSNRMVPNTNDYYESGNSDSSVTLRKKVYSLSHQPTLPSRQNSGTFMTSPGERTDVKLRGPHVSHQSVEMTKHPKRQSNDYQMLPITNVRSSSKHSSLDTDPITTDDPVYTDPASISNNNYASEAVDSRLYQRPTHWKATASRTNDEPTDENVILLGINNQINTSSDTTMIDGYLTCEYSQEVEDGGKEGDGSNRKRDSLSSPTELLRNQPVPSTSTTDRLAYRSRISGEIHPYDNVQCFRKPQQSISTQRNSTDADRPISSGSDIRSKCSSGPDVRSCRTNSCREKDACSCGNSSCGAEVTCSCRNSSSETDSIVSCGNSSCETCSVVSCGNSSCETFSVVSCGNSSCETCSVVSCGNSSCGTKNEFELNTKL